MSEHTVCPNFDHICCSPGAAKPWISVFIVSGLVAVFLLITFALILCQQYVTRKRNLPKALVKHSAFFLSGSCTKKFSLLVYLEGVLTQFPGTDRL